MSITYPYPKTAINESLLRMIEEGSIEESTEIDFKESLYRFNVNEDKKSFVRDVTGMLNAKGGLILLGVTDDGELTGLEEFDVDSFKVTALQIINSNIEPQIIGVEFISLRSQGKLFFGILIPEGHSKPYCVRFTGGITREFPIRQNASSHPMAMTEIRRLFISSPGQEVFANEWNDWRRQQVENILNLKWLKPISDAQCLLVLVHPIESKIDKELIPASSVVQLANKNHDVWPPYHDGRTITPVPGGIITVARKDGDFGEGNPCFSFFAINENGSIQIYSALTPVTKDGSKVIHSSIENQIFDALRRSVSFYNSAGLGHIEVKAVAYLLKMKGFKFKSGNDFDFFPGGRMTAVGIQDDVFEVSVQFLVNDFGRSTVKPMMDKLWHLGGYDRSYNYDEDGNFIGKNEFR